MKKIMAVLTVLMCFASMSLFSQEVRGIESRRVIYEGGKEYVNGNSYGYRTHSTEYYGWEFKNCNSCGVSVDISLFRQATEEYGRAIPAKVLATKSIVLQAGETYVYKPEIEATRTEYYLYNGPTIDQLYVEYKAFKLQ